MFTSDINALLDQQALQGQDPECRYIIDRVNCEKYEALLARNGDTSAYRATYLDGALEIWICWVMVAIASGIICG